MKMKDVAIHCGHQANIAPSTMIIRLSEHNTNTRIAVEPTILWLTLTLTLEIPGSYVSGLEMRLSIFSDSVLFEKIALILTVQL